MANDTIWVEKFKISEDLKAEFAKDPSSDKSFLVWCIENGHVDEREYLSWASQEFQIPIVNSEFFVNDEVIQRWRETWTTARFLHQWNPSLLPLDESVGVIRVGCLQIPEFKLESPVAFVLAPLAGMKLLWSEAFPTAASSEIVEVTATALPPPPQEFDANSLMSSWGSLEEASEVPAVPDAEQEEPAEMPEGFAMPEGFSVSDVPLPTMEAIAPPTESVVEIPVPKIPVPEVVEQAAPVATIVVKAKTPPPLPPLASPEPPAADVAAKPAGDFVGLIELRNAKDKLEECDDLSDVAKHAFTKFSRYFDRHMILMMKGFELRPFVWAGSWKFQSARPAGISLDQPSIFRIVSRTKLPYHGYTKPSACNDMFFGEWNNGVSPAHVTVMPILVNDQLVGMLVGATDGSLDAKVALTDAERWMTEISLHISRTKTAAPKAA